MSILLRGTGVILIIIGIITGFQQDSTMAALFSIFIGISSGVLFFAVGRILDIAEALYESHFVPPLSQSLREQSSRTASLGTSRAKLDSLKDFKMKSGDSENHKGD
ncbi:hypothetical protein SY83_14405 [Paenibacillus swuensis]|uniref:Uncharacterized protein n=1 Tax=Paenibacillus swuensis TaxID=1178515 RepID=A0A172TJW1_9BACL|nr:hypothetical protein [Paenibacillus swuensis]ANE47262.1 hypothetical protein SY83_14405 [Paenibacillus swuensis]